jgi:hypothetical protein
MEPRPALGTTHFRALVGISIALTLTTLVFRFRTHYFLWLAPLDLSHENDVAAWFSGMLLLLAALHALDGFRRLQSTDVKSAIAWLLIAAMLVVLSADEVGSLHERIEDLSPGPVLSFVPFAIVLVGASIWVLWQLWRTPSERAMVPGLVLGFIMLFSVGGLEIFERIVQLPWYVRPFRTAFEEGWELAGMLVLIYAIRSNSREGFALSGVAALRWFFVAGAALIAWPLASITASLNDQADLGHLSDWLSASLLLLSAALLVRNSIRAVDPKGFPAAGVFMLCTASALCVQIDPTGDTSVFPYGVALQLFGTPFNLRLLLLALCCVGAGESFRIRGERAGIVLLMCAGLMSALLAAHNAESSLTLGYFTTTVVALATFTSVVLIHRWEPVPTLARKLSV